MITTDKIQKPAFKIKASWGAEAQTGNKINALIAIKDKTIAQIPGFLPSQNVDWIIAKKK
jgi:hypothetical protein